MGSSQIISLVILLEIPLKIISSEIRRSDVIQLTGSEVPEYF